MYNNSRPAQVGPIYPASTAPLTKRALSLQTPSMTTNAQVGISQTLPRHCPSPFNGSKAVPNAVDADSGMPDAAEELSKSLDPAIVGVKRRLGVGRNNAGYTNKKFKAPSDTSQKVPYTALPPR
jgi:DNA helicase-2/ATP-dependent DNA helicase PcrA